MKNRLNFWILLGILVNVGICGLGCVRMYSLPDAPPKSEWKSVAEAPKESPEELMRRFLDAKRAAIQCYAALADGRFDDASEWMSRSTVDFFNAHSDGAGLAQAFEDDHLFFDGEEQPFDPVADVFIGQLTDIRDDFGGREDAESATRKVLYAVSASGKARELVFVYEDDKWRLDCPHAPKDLLTE